MWTKNILRENNINVDEEYIKEKNEDFITLLSGIIGQKKRIHIHVGDILENEYEKIKIENDNNNKQIQALAQVIDDSILKSYKLWPTNFIAYDILNTTSRFAHLYDDKERQLFERRLEMRIDAENETMEEPAEDETMAVSACLGTARCACVRAARGS